MPQLRVTGDQRQYAFFYVGELFDLERELISDLHLAIAGIRIFSLSKGCILLVPVELKGEAHQLLERFAEENKLATVFTNDDDGTVRIPWA